MSTAEIGDNKWEVSAAKPPVTSISGLSSLLMMSGFAVFFVLLIVGSLMGILSEKNEDAGFVGGIKNLNSEAADKEE